ncbi:MAG: hypothetical protein ABIN58_01930 [candidate division WOR-3 bacterium]
MDAALPEAMGRDEWLNKLGFVFDPFEYEAADELAEGDPYLHEYFVEFPYFDELKKPRSCILFTQRGGGKSANRLRLAEWCEDSFRRPAGGEAYLAVHYVDFLTVLADITLARHIEAILRQAVPALLDALFQHMPGALKGLSPQGKEDLSWFVQKYSDRLIPAGLREELKAVGSSTPKITPDKVTPVADHTIKAVGSIFKRAPVEAVQEAVQGLIELFRWEFKETEAGNWLRTEPLEIARRFVAVVKELGISGVFVLVDRVDEFQGTAGRPERQVELLRPLLANLPLLGIFAFKCFLPLELLPELRRRLGADEFREDRILIREVRWETEDIKRILEHRLAAGSQRRHSSFNSLVAGIKPEESIDDRLVEFAYHSPRDLIQLCERIFSEHTRLPTTKLLIEGGEIDSALSWFSRTRARRLYQDDHLARLIRIRQLPFSVPLVCQSLNRSEEEVRDLLNTWEKIGLIRQVAAKDDLPTYDVPDPRARLVWEEEHIDEPTST